MYYFPGFGLPTLAGPKRVPDAYRDAAQRQAFLLVGQPLAGAAGDLREVHREWVATGGAALLRVRVRICRYLYDRSPSRVIGILTSGATASSGRAVVSGRPAWTLEPPPAPAMGTWVGVLKRWASGGTNRSATDRTVVRPVGPEPPEDLRGSLQVASLRQPVGEQVGVDVCRGLEFDVRHTACGVHTAGAVDDLGPFQKPNVT
jgi:hypothetical protein